MSDRLQFTVDELDAERHVRAVCQRCGDTRYLIRPMLREMAPGQTLAKIEQRVRCISRLSNRRGPACGGRMEIDIYRRSVPNPTTESTVELSHSLARYMSRREGH